MADSTDGTMDDSLDKEVEQAAEFFFPPGDDGQMRTPVEILAAKKAELGKLMKENGARFAALGSVPGIQLPTADLMNLRIHTLAEMLFGDGPGMTEFQLRYERKLEGISKDMLAQLRKAQLASAAQATPQQVQQMARKSGLLGPNGRPLS